MKKLLAVLLSSIILIACSNKAKKPQLPEHHVDILVVKPHNVPYGFDYPASISGVTDFQVVPRVNGVIFKQLYKEGTFVKKDQPLYEIDPRPFQNQLKADQGQLIKDQTATKEYKDILDRYMQLYKVGGVSKQDIETATINYKNSFGQVETDKANIENDKLNITYCSVNSPVDGLISERMVTVGTMVTAFQTVLNNINSKTNMYVNFSVPENDRLELQNGIADGKVAVPADYKFMINLQLADGTMLDSVGKVNFFDTRISLQNGTWNMRADVDNSKIQDRLLSGQFVHIYLVGASFSNAIAIPQAAVFRDDKGSFVYIVDNASKIEKLYVQTGVMNGQLWVIDKGLKTDDKVVINGGMKVSVGDKIISDSTTIQNKLEIESS
ncbi:MAG: efflux RND transporter periplasmic adaptor subunit [Proteobacteria bacterium]|jgi:membrane fusion protein (multidrug efflux system)|nr:efflux RND transporter periplasmic adaptor subunit [Pseudomonadota bacterium]